MTPYRHSRIEILYNWSNGSLVGRDKDYGYNLYRKLGISEKVVLFYGGNIGQAQDMRNILRLSEGLLRLQHAHVLLIGQGDEYELVQTVIAEKSLKNVSLLPSVSQSQYSSILNQVDVGLFSLSAKHSTHNFPGKLLGYMVAKIPILGSVNSGNDIVALLNTSEAGFVSVNGDDNRFLDNAIELANSYELRLKMGHNANSLLNSVFSVKNAASQILASMEYSENLMTPSDLGCH